MNPREPLFDPRSETEPPASPAPDAVPREPELFPDLASSAGGGPEIPPPPHAPAVAGWPRDGDGDEGTPAARRYLWIGVGGISAVAILLPFLMWMQQAPETVVADADLPLVAAAETPEKVRPAVEGGMQVPNQELEVYGSLGGDTQPTQPEVLLAEPEAPLPLPAVPAATEEKPVVAADPPDAIPSVPAPAIEVGDGAADEVAAVEPSAGGEKTGDEAAAPAPAADEQTATLGESFRIQLAAVKSREGAESTWVKLQKKHGELLSGLQLAVVEIDKGEAGKFFRVQAGPFADRAAATKTCVALKAVDQGCLVVNP
jgi:cell division septation protein DedD